MKKIAIVMDLTPEQYDGLCTALARYREDNPKSDITTPEEYARFVMTSACDSYYNNL